ncbi:MAG TPA: tetratricopeptide repeat protein [Kofleriaceae bacterium]|nr:tetratricopeptide repeat protein [Kofleriaceae bacterium]
MKPPSAASAATRPPRAAPSAEHAAAAGPESSETRATRRAPRASAAGRGKPAEVRAAHRHVDATPDQLYRDGARLYLDGNLDDARRKFQTAVDIAPRFAPAHRGLGLVYERAGQKALAIRSWQTYLRIAPDAPDAALIRARLERLGR